MSQPTPRTDLQTISGSSDMLRNADVGHMLELREKLSALERELAAEKRGPITTDLRTFPTALEASLHLLWVIQRLSYSEPHREGQPADGPRLREVIRESRKLIAELGYEPGKPLPAPPEL